MGFMNTVLARIIVIGLFAVAFTLTGKAAVVFFVLALVAGAFACTQGDDACAEKFNKKNEDDDGN